LSTTHGIQPINKNFFDFDIIINKQEISYVHIYNVPRVSIYIFTTPKIINPGGNKLRDRESRVERYSRMM